MKMHYNTKPLTYEVNNGCFEVTSHAIRPDGYVMLVRDGEFILAHRHAYRESLGTIPEGMLVCHTCDNRKCVNPEHLFLGTYTDNNRDCENKGRRNHPEGEASNLSKLTAGQVSEIREIGYALSARILANQFGVCVNTINKIRQGKSWKE